MTDRGRLLSSWIALQENWWAHEELHDRCESDPEFAWSILLELIETGLAPDVLDVMAAGPLEDLLRAHGTLLIERVETQAKMSARLREALAIVRVPDAGDDLSNRMLALGCARLPSQSASIGQIANEAMLAWAAAAGLVPDPRYPESPALVFEAFPDCWSAWSPPGPPGDLPAFLEAAITSSNPNGPYSVRMRGGGAFAGNTMSPVMREQALSRVLGTLHLPGDVTGGLIFHRAHWSALMLLTTTYFAFGYCMRTDLEIVPTDRRVCLMLDHHGSLVGHFAGEGVLGEFTEAMRHAGYAPEGEE